MPLKEGQQVLIKIPGAKLVGTVIRPRPGDAGQPEEKTHYQVQIHPERLWLLSTDLEPVQEPSKAKLKPYSAEWTAELERMVAGAKRWQSNNKDRAAWDQLVEAGEKLGFIVPINKETK